MSAMRAFVLVLIVGCGGVDERTVRWPAHRKDRDARIEQLEREVQTLETRVHALEHPPAPAHTPDPPAPQS